VLSTDAFLVLPAGAEWRGALPRRRRRRDGNKCFDVLV